MSLTTCFIHRHQNSQLAERVREGERCLAPGTLLPALIMQESGSVGAAPALWPQIQPLHSLFLNGLFICTLSKLIPPTHSSGDISQGLLRSRIQCCKRLCWRMCLNESTKAYIK